MDLVQTRRSYLVRQRAALLSEFQAWRDRTVNPPTQNARPPLEKHKTQIERITRQLESFLADIPEPPAAGGNTLSTYRDIHAALFFAQRVWAYYREKFALRDVIWLANDLRCADELAWHCYKPAVDAAKAAGTLQEGQLKEPPLVFFDSDGTPYAISRGRSFKPDGITEREEEQLGDVLLTLPIPVIGIPWHQVDHLPGGVAIGHEVGHAVWWDFQLRKPYENAFRGLQLENDADRSRADAWLKWLPELFADAYGVLATGAAFALGLSAYLAEPEPVVRQERQTKPWEVYPGKYLRMKVVLGLLAALKVDDEGVAAAWKATYGSHQMCVFEPDIPAVVAALLGTSLPAFGGPIVNVLKPPADASKWANNLLANLALKAGPDFRLLFAMAGLAFVRDPDTYATRSQNGELKQKFVDRIPQGVRSRKLDGKAETEQTQADRAAGSALLSRLLAQVHAEEAQMQQEPPAQPGN
jgi:hypothetical protein